MDKKEVLITKVRNLVGKTGFLSDREHALYSIHKCFDVIIHNGLLFNDSFTLQEDETILRINRVIPPVMPIEYFFRKYDKMWSQEHKCWFLFEYSKQRNDIIIKFTIDRITKPERVFKKEHSTPELLKEFGLNKYKKGE